jgi:hypothetical protein
MPLLYVWIYAGKRRAGKAEMNLDPTGSPRHEQTVAVALIFIIAQRRWRNALRGNLKDKSKVTKAELAVSEQTTESPDSRPAPGPGLTSVLHQTPTASKVLLPAADIRKVTQMGDK